MSKNVTLTATPATYLPLQQGKIAYSRAALLWLANSPMVVNYNAAQLQLPPDFVQSTAIASVTRSPKP